MKEFKHFLYSLKTEILPNLITNLKNVYLHKKNCFIYLKTRISEIILYLAKTEISKKWFYIFI